MEARARNLGRAVHQEWGSYLQATTSLQYDLARRSWIGDYLDPNTFLNMMVTGDGNNRTGWSDPRYDAMMREASFTVDPERRLEILSRAEALLLEESPVIPIYHYSVNDLVKPYVRGLYTTTLDTHPMKFVYVEHDWQRKPESVVAGALPPIRTDRVRHPNFRSARRRASTDTSPRATVGPRFP